MSPLSRFLSADISQSGVVRLSCHVGKVVLSSDQKQRNLVYAHCGLYDLERQL